MAQEGCPVTVAFLRGIKEIPPGDARMNPFSLEDDCESQMGMLLEEAMSSTPERKAVMLRGFYVVEVLYSSLLPGSLAPSTAASSLTSIATDGRRLKSVHSWRFDRSYSGMTELLERLHALEQTCKATSIAVSLDRRVDAGLRSHHRDRTELWKGVSLALRAAATEVRRALRHSDLDGTAVGRNFAVAWRRSSQLTEEGMAHASILLGINQHNAVYPWDKKTSFQESPSS